MGAVSRGVGAVGRQLSRGPGHVVLVAARGVGGVGRYGGVAMLCAFYPRGCKLLGLAAILSGPTFFGVLPLPLPPAARRALAPLAPLRGPFAAFAAMRLVLPLAAPSVWRNIMYWQRTVPIVTRYVRTGRRAGALSRRGRSLEAEALWAEQHEWGAGAIFDMLCDLKGFYLKLGQILACKTDMLPGPYTESLSRLLDRLPPVPYSAVRRTIRAELGASPEVLFRDVDPFPLASATIAQVHRATLPDGRAVVVKVQHRSARRMMRGDLANLSRLSGLLAATGMDLGFDHGSLIREYNLQVPLEFDFVREAAVATAIRSSLAAHSAALPALRRVVVPAMVPGLSSSKVLTMEYLDGVPLLDIAGMDLAVRHGLMSSLILAYGVMILRDGLFHSDPHPGNVLALRRRLPPAQYGPGASPYSHSGTGADADTDELHVALLDFGQTKELPAASRARYALLVAALAVRDDELVRAVMAELGLVVDNCSEQFAATACYILYDTRMDFPEAHMGPMDPDAHEFRTAKVPSLPQDLFMIMRVITLLRGLLSSLQVDISSAQLWRPLALQTLADLTPLRKQPSLLPPHQQQQLYHTQSVDRQQHQQQHLGYASGRSAPVSPTRSRPSGTYDPGSLPLRPASPHSPRGPPTLPPPEFTAAVVAAAVAAPPTLNAPRATSPARAASPSSPRAPFASVQLVLSPEEEEAARQQLALSKPRRGLSFLPRLGGGGGGSGSGSPVPGSPRGQLGGRFSVDKAAAEAAKQAEREAAEARRRQERAAQEAVRRAEEERKRLEWEATEARKREQRAAKMQRLQAEREAAEARKQQLRAEREAKKRAEIAAANARRAAQKSAAEAKKRFEKLMAEEKKRSRSAPPARPPGQLPGQGQELQSTPGVQALPSAGIIQTPVPLRTTAPYGGMGPTYGRLGAPQPNAGPTSRFAAGSGAMASPPLRSVGYTGSVLGAGDNSGPGAADWRLNPAYSTGGGSNNTSEELTSVAAAAEGQASSINAAAQQLASGAAAARGMHPAATVGTDASGGAFAGLPGRSGSSGSAGTVRLGSSGNANHYAGGALGVERQVAAAAAAAAPAGLGPTAAAAAAAPNTPQRLAATAGELDDDRLNANLVQRAAALAASLEKGPAATSPSRLLSATPPGSPPATYPASSLAQPPGSLPSPLPPSSAAAPAPSGAPSAPQTHHERQMAQLRELQEQLRELQQQQRSRTPSPHRLRTANGPEAPPAPAARPTSSQPPPHPGTLQQQGSMHSQGQASAKASLERQQGQQQPSGSQGHSGPASPGRAPASAGQYAGATEQELVAKAMALLESTRKLVPPDQQQGARPPSPGSAGLGKSRSGIPSLSDAGSASTPSALAQPQQQVQAQPTAAGGLGAGTSAAGRSAGGETTPPLSAKSSYMSVSGRPSHEIEPAATRTPFQPGAAGQVGQQQQQQQQQGREGSGHGGGDFTAAQAGAAAAGSGGGSARLHGDGSSPSGANSSWSPLPSSSAAAAATRSRSPGSVQILPPYQPGSPALASAQSAPHPIPAPGSPAMSPGGRSVSPAVNWERYGLPSSPTSVDWGSGSVGGSQAGGEGTPRSQQSGTGTPKLKGVDTLKQGFKRIGKKLVSGL